MIDFNGWIEIHMSIDDDSDDESDLEVFFEDIKPYFDYLNKYDNQFVELKNMNGLNVFYLGGAHNHELSYLDDLISFYKKIGERATGSFGLLYVRLSEDPTYWNKYKVFRLAKGAFTEHDDHLLSPCIPIIE